MHYALLCLLRLSHDLQAFLNFLMNVDMFSGMYTSQGSGNIVVRMCGSWKKIMVDQRRSRRILEQAKQWHYAFLCLLQLSHDLQAFLNVLMHVDMFSGMYTSKGSGDTLVRMCGTCLHALEHLKKPAGRVRGEKGIKRLNALFHLLQNAPRPALIYHDFLPASTHAHKYIT